MAKHGLAWVDTFSEEVWARMPPEGKENAKKYALASAKQHDCLIATIRVKEDDLFPGTMSEETGIVWQERVVENDIIANERCEVVIELKARTPSISPDARTEITNRLAKYFKGTSYRIVNGAGVALEFGIIGQDAETGEYA